MADLSDITSYLATTAASAVYPTGTSSPSVASMDVRISEGWPIAAQLDLDMAGKMLSASGVPVIRPGGPVANVTIFPMQGAGIEVYQILNETYTITPPVFGLTVSVSGNVTTVSGQPGTGEYLTVVCDDTYVYSSGGATTSALLSALATAAQANYPSASSTATTLTIPVGHSLIVRKGATATLGKVTHRQRHPVMVTIWTPTQASRAVLAKAIDGLIKQKITVSMPDTSMAKIVYSRTNVSDIQESMSTYRRDLIYDCEYATVQQFTGYVITTVNTSIANYNNSSVIPAIT